MADKKISELNQVVEVGLNDMLLVVQDGTSKRASAQQLSNLLNVDLTLGELSDVSVSDIQDGQTILWDELANKYRPADIPNAASINNILNEIIAANASISDVVSSIQTVVGTYDTQITDLGSRITSVDSYYSIVTGATNAAVASVESHVNTVSAANSTTNARVTSVDNYFLNQVSVLSGSLVSVDSRVNTVDSRVTSVMGEVSNLTSVELTARVSLANSINTVSGNLTSLQGTVNAIQSQVNIVSAAVTSVNTRLSNTSVALETRIDNVSVAAIRNIVSLADTSISTGAGVNQFALSWDNPSNKFSLRNPVPDGDKGDITVSAGVWTIDNGVVTNSKLANNAVTTSVLASSAVDLTSKVTNTLPVTNGGTGVTSLTSGQFPVGQGTSPVVMSSKMTYNTTTNQVTFGDNTSSDQSFLEVFCGNTQFPTNALFRASGHATSRRAGIFVGDWGFLQDLSGDGTKNFTIYNSIGAFNSLFIDTSGRMACQLQPLFLGQRSAGNVVGAADFVASNVTTNRGSHYNTTTGIFTCPVAGDYLVEFVSGGGAAVQSAVQLNGTTVVAHLSQITGIISCVVACAANDQLKIRVLSGTVTANAVNTNHLAIRLLV